MRSRVSFETAVSCTAPLGERESWLRAAISNSTLRGSSLLMMGTRNDHCRPAVGYRISTGTFAFGLCRPDRGSRRGTVSGCLIGTLDTSQMDAHVGSPLADPYWDPSCKIHRFHFAGLFGGGQESTLLDLELVAHLKPPDGTTGRVPSRAELIFPYTRMRSCPATFPDS